MNIKNLATMRIAFIWSVLVTIQGAYAMQEDCHTLSNERHNRPLITHALESTPMTQKGGILVQQKVIDRQLDKAYELYSRGKILPALQFVKKRGVIVKFNFGMFLFTQKNFASAQYLFQEVADTRLSSEEMKDALTRKSLASAQFNLALMLEITADKDGNLRKSEALQYYRLAASNGSLDAHFNATLLLCETENY